MKNVRMIMLLAMAILVNQVSAADWPQYLGPDSGNPAGHVLNDLKDLCE